MRKNMTFNLKILSIILILPMCSLFNYATLANCTITLNTTHILNPGEWFYERFEGRDCEDASALKIHIVWSSSPGMIEVLNDTEGYDFYIDLFISNFDSSPSHGTNMSGQDYTVSVGDTYYYAEIFSNYFGNETQTVQISNSTTCPGGIPGFEPILIILTSTSLTAIVITFIKKKIASKN